MPSYRFALAARLGRGLVADKARLGLHELGDMLLGHAESSHERLHRLLGHALTVADGTRAHIEVGAFAVSVAYLLQHLAHVLARPLVALESAIVHGQEYLDAILHITAVCDRDRIAWNLIANDHFNSSF